MEETLEIKIMRAMAWERAKGELMSMLQTFFDNKEKFEALDEAIKKLVAEVEDNELQM